MSGVQLEVSRTRGDIVKGIAANMARSRGALLAYVIGALIVAVIAILANADVSTQTKVIIGAIAFAAMLVLYSIIIILGVLFAAQKSWKAPGTLDPVKYTFSDEGLGVEASIGHGMTSWVAWKTAFETKSLIVIRHQFNMIHIIPKRGLSKDLLNAVKSMLNKHLKTARLQMENAE
jgi:hypothetical protein